MADLDDFFAKKDKKKGVKKAGLKPGSRSPSTGRTPTPESGEKATTSAPAATLSTTIKPTIFQSQDDDWIVPEEKKIDYTGLRIQDLSVNETEEKVEDEESADPEKTTGKKTWGAAKKPADTAVNSINFPSLSQATGDIGVAPPPGMKSFTTVKNGYRGEGGMRQSDRVQVSNRYQAFDAE